MYYFLIALLLSVIVSIPLYFGKEYVAGFIVVVVGTMVGWWAMYASAAGFPGPMFGGALFFLAIALTCAALLVGMFDSNTSNPITTAALPVLAWIALLGILLSGSPVFNASEYRALVGNMEKRVWTQDIQPKDPEHTRLVSDENALYLARKVVGEIGTIGSQFQVREDSLTLQAIKGDLWYVVPLDFAGWRAWLNQGTSVGYIMIHAEDPNHQPIVKQLPKEKQFVYTPGAWFGNDLIRHLRQYEGNLRVDLKGTHLEIDENGEPWWITAAEVPTIGQFGNKVQGVFITNPVTGDSTFAKLGEVPAWVDRVMPEKLTMSYLNHWGNYVHGWMNSWWQNRDLTEAEKPSLIYSSAHDPMFVTGITSQNNRDDSLVGVVYTHTRTGKSVYYEVKGGATDDAVLNGVSKFQDVQFKHLHPANPQLYNLYGTMTSVVPLVNENHAYSGVAIANINNIQQIAIGRSLSEAVRQYQRLLGQTGDLAHLANDRKLSVIEGVLARAKQDLAPTGSVYYIVLQGGKQVFVGGTGEFPLIPLAQAGDKVEIEFINSGESIVPMHSFKNLSLVLVQTAGEVSVSERKLTSQEVNETKPVRQNLEERVRNATPKELKILEGKLGQ